jgi:catalytic LigB subunit of aromatic ring-opening dioxygenase
MAEILGLGISHYPPLSGLDKDMANAHRARLNDPHIPATAKDPNTWSQLAQREWADPVAAAAFHRAAMRRGISRVRQALDEFAPDFVLIWGDDQYENFKEDIVPAFSILAYEDMTIKPWQQASESSGFNASVVDEWGGGRPNVWGERGDTERLLRGHPEAAKYLAAKLLEAEFDIAYAYRPLHHPGLAHAFLNAVLYLDYDRTGFDWPVVAMPINCYGSQVISYRGFISRWADRGRPADPPSPSPKRCFDMGAATARILRDSPWRVAVLASSSWSHAFLCDKTYRLAPDVASDRLLYQAMQDGDFEYWRNYKLEQLVDSGQQEVLNWHPLLGAMQEIGATLEYSDFVETGILNSSKVAAVYSPV